MLFGQSVKLMGRQLMQNTVRNGSHGGVPGENLPFQIQNRYRLTALFILFFGSGIAAPFMIVRHQLLKK
ncbi:cytochrome c oxidase subunit 7C, mitochondrial-like [Bradysia coprophila]|uniref:cytochrome c oxidase subunit 7C, mitochondrial-like n=1 Tax=Bradysia coprophila TaxID=38358 RepID=UPI00187DCC0F|nr:cytochrome c oxidase subunit 7C, mitochondrial-like [Bradysia coprophila]